MGGALGRGRGLLDWHDALPAQDQARPFHGPRAALDGPLGGRDGVAYAVLVKHRDGFGSHRCSPSHKPTLS